MPARAKNMTGKTAHGVRMVAHFLIASLLVILVTVPAQLQAEAVTQAEINALRQKQTEIASSKREIQSQLNQIQGEKDRLLDQKNLLEQQIEGLRQELEVLNEMIRMTDELIVETTLKLEEAERQEAIYFQAFCDRVRFMEERGNVTYLSVLFDAADFSDFLDRVNTISEIVNYDNYIMEQLEIARLAVAAAKAELEEQQAEQLENKALLEAAQADLRTQQAAVQALYDQIKAEEAKYKVELETLEDEAADISNELEAAEKQYAAQIAAAQQAAQSGTLTGTGGFIWPLPGYTYISSHYGPRTHPVTGAKYSNHTGIDLPAPAGTNIIAAKSGTVVISSYNSSYGNYVVIAHTDGSKTLYAHMRSRAVSAGQIVSQKDVIGYVGTTGSSTGNHLHFEVWTGSKSASRVNPMQFF